MCVCVCAEVLERSSLVSTLISLVVAACLRAYTLLGLLFLVLVFACISVRRATLEQDWRVIPAIIATFMLVQLGGMCTTSAHPHHYPSTSSHTFHHHYYPVHVMHVSSTT